jgi:hypothetical protein
MQKIKMGKGIVKGKHNTNYKKNGIKYPTA